MGKKKIRKLKKKLNKMIELYGRGSPKVLEISQKLDIYIVKEMKRYKDTMRN